MMSSKYSSLPDIDTAPDVYETADVPIETTQSLDSDSDSDYLAPRAGSPSTRRGLSSSLTTTGGGGGGANGNGQNGGGQTGGSPEDENLVARRLDAQSARQRFSGSIFERGDSSNGPKRPTHRRLPTTSTYALGASPSLKEAFNEPETNLERLRRLRFEINELEEDVRREQSQRMEERSKEDLGGGTRSGLEDEASPTIRLETDDVKGTRKKQPGGGISPAIILRQLQMLRGDLDVVHRQQTEEEDRSPSEPTKGSDDPKSTTVLQEKVNSSATLLGRLGEAFTGTGTGTTTSQVLPMAAASSTSKVTSSTVEDSNASPNRGALEKRVAELEKLIGASEADVDETHPIPPPLLTTVARLDHLLTLLTQPRHLDSISRRVKVLVSELERLHESRRKLGDTRPLNVALSGGMTVSNGPTTTTTTSNNNNNIINNNSGDTGSKIGISSGSGTGNIILVAPGTSSTAQLPPDALQKIDALFSLLPRLDPLLPLAPRVLNRLRSLSTLHASAHEFGTTLTQLKEEISRLSEAENGLNQVVEGVGKSLEENEKRMKGNLEGLEKRVRDVVKRLEAVKGCSDDDEDDEEDDEE